MSAPPLLLGAAALFWGAQSGFWAPAVAAALALEAPHLVARRIGIDLARQKRVADFCIVVAALVGVGCYIAYGNPRAIVLLFEWLPLLLLPLMMMQLWGEEPALRLDVIFWGLRRLPEAGLRRVYLTYPYLVVWLVGAAGANARGESFSIGVVGLGAWAMWSARRERSRAFLWAAQIVLVAALGTLLHLGLHGAQLWLEGAAPDWMTGSGGTRTNPYRASTDMGSIGDLKESDNIVLRVKMARQPSAMLLHRASYNEYGGAAWLARGARFAEVLRTRAGEPWVLRPGLASGVIEVAEQAIHGNPVLSLPSGALSVQGGAISLKAGTLGAVQAEAAPGFFIYRVAFGSLSGAMQAPDASDLKLPARERVAITQAAAQFELAGKNQRAAVLSIRRGFEARYSYATKLRPATEGRTALADFLLATRAGHCEYFASATVLLLRAAGVPARYATGFSLQEYDAASGSYLVRERHAHAWVRAWIDGAWVDIDTTPPNWAQAEEAANPPGARWRTRVSDAWSTLQYRYAIWQRDSSEAEKWGWFGAIGGLVLAWLGWRVFGGGRGSDASAATRGLMTLAPLQTVTGKDSPLYAVLARCAAEGKARHGSESINEWIARMLDQGVPGAAELVRLASLHYRLRFDPAGLKADEQRALCDGCAAWLAARVAAAQRD